MRKPPPRATPPARASSPLLFLFPGDRGPKGEKGDRGGELGKCSWGGTSLSPHHPVAMGAKPKGAAKNQPLFSLFYYFFLSLFLPFCFAGEGKGGWRGGVGRNGRSNMEEKKEKLIFGVVGGDSEGKGLGGCARRDGAVAEAPQGLILQHEGQLFWGISPWPRCWAHPRLQLQSPQGARKEKKKAWGGSGSILEPGPSRSWKPQISQIPSERALLGNIFPNLGKIPLIGVPPKPPSPPIRHKAQNEAVLVKSQHVGAAPKI